MTTNTGVNTTSADYSLEIVELIRSNLTPKRMQEKLSSYHENDIASTLSFLTESERMKLYQILDSETLADILEYSDHISDYVGELNSSQKSRCFFQNGNFRCGRCTSPSGKRRTGNHHRSS